MYSIKENGLVSIEARKNADNEALTGTGVDMAGYGAVTFIALAEGGEDASFSIKAQQAAASDFSDAADLVGTATAFATVASPSTDAMAVLEIRNPQERYVRAVATAPNVSAAKVVSVIAIRTDPRNLPVSNAGELHVGPAEGTA